MTTYVLVPGMFHGGWCFADLTARLRALGHRVHPLTLSGVSERAYLPHGGINLDTHIQDVTTLLAGEDIVDAVLVGHSYGGMVITGAADRVPDRVSALVYLDAVVPGNGDSCWRLVSDRERAWYADVDETGLATRPLPFFDRRATSHPVGSLLQPIALSGVEHGFRRVYVYAAGWDGESPFTPTYERLRDDPAWTTHALAGGHHLMRDVPADLLAIVASVTPDRVR